MARFEKREKELETAMARQGSLMTFYFDKWKEVEALRAKDIERDKRNAERRCDIMQDSLKLHMARTKRYFEIFLPNMDRKVEQFNNREMYLGFIFDRWRNTQPLMSYRKWPVRKTRIN